MLYIKCLVEYLIFSDKHNIEATINSVVVPLSPVTPLFFYWHHLIFSLKDGFSPKSVYQSFAPPSFSFSSSPPPPFFLSSVPLHIQRYRKKEEKASVTLTNMLKVPKWFKELYKHDSKWNKLSKKTTRVFWGFPFQFPNKLLFAPAGNTTLGNWEVASSLLLFWKCPGGGLQLPSWLSSESKQIGPKCLRI